MEIVIESFTEWIRMLHPSLIVLIISAIAYLENVVPPIPGDMVVVFAGFLASEGVIRIVPVYLGTTIASVVGFLSMYYVGGYLRKKSIQLNEPDSRFRRFLDPKHLKNARNWMTRWGQWVIFSNRFLAGTRSVIALTAGFSRTPVMLTSLNSFLSSLCWNAVLIYMGFVIHENLSVIGNYLSIYSRSISILIVLFVTFFVARAYLKRKRKRQIRTS